jgi:alkaline phosphatase D
MLKILGTLSLLMGILLLIAVSMMFAADERVYLAMGFRVGEVTQTSAIVWTRVCSVPVRRQDGIRDLGRPGPKSAEFVPLAHPVSEYEGSVPGAEGEVRVHYATNSELQDVKTSPWIQVHEEDDFAALVKLEHLTPGQKYHLKVEARPGTGGGVTASPVGSFQTPAGADQKQEVSFTVVTGQAYKDVDHFDGYTIYPSMRALQPNFIVLTGDTVYYDNEKPRARTVELARYHWHRMYSLPRLVEFHRSIPGYWLKDDHDILADDTWPGHDPEWMKPMTFEKGQKIFREQVPVGDSPYRTIRWGQDLQIWLVEGRDFRSPNPQPDGPTKTIWGKKQLEWLKETILQSDATYRVLVSPTPIVGPDRPSKADNHSNSNFSYEGNLFRSWTKEHGLSNFFVVCGDRHWQYLSVDPASGLREFSCGPASDEHSGGTPGEDPTYHRFHRVGGGFLSVSVSRQNDQPEIAFRLHDVLGNVVYERIYR